VNCPLIPDIRGLTDMVKEQLIGNTSFETLLSQFSNDQRQNPNIEELLSHVRLLGRVVGSGDARGLTKTQLEELETELCRTVAVAVHQQLPSQDTPYHKLAHWIGGIRRSKPVQIFTTNYDLLLEQALEELELPFFDGFVGTRQPFFDIRSIEDDAVPPRWTRLWKLHGSINWQFRYSGSHTVTESRAVIRVPPDPAAGKSLLIHPSEQKYDESRRMPYLAMLDRVRAFLRQPSALLVTAGFSFADEHLNEVLLQGQRSNPTAAAFGLLYGTFANEPGANRISAKAPKNLSLLANDAGVVRSRLEPWLQPGAGGASSVPRTCDYGDFAKFATFLHGLSLS